MSVTALQDYASLVRDFTAPLGSITGVTSVGTSGLATGGPITGSGTVNVPDPIPVAHGGTNLVSGTSGGILAFTGPTTLASSAALGANLPVIGGGAGAAPTTGTRSGNTTIFATISGSGNVGDLWKLDGSGNLVDAGVGIAAAWSTGSIPFFDGSILNQDNTKLFYDSVGKRLSSKLLDMGGAVYNVKSLTYGAKGDGSTDDTTPIQNAINDAQASGGVVYLPTGVYLVSATLTVTAAGVSIVGAGKTATIIKTNSSTLDIVAIGNTGAPFNVGGIRDLSFNSSVTRTAGWCITISGMQDFFITNVRCQTTNGNGLRFGSGGFLAAIGFISDCSIFTTGAFVGMEFDSGNERYVSSCWLQGDLTAGSIGMKFAGSAGDYFRDVSVVTYEAGIKYTGGTNTFTTFNNVLSDQNAVSGFDFSAGSNFGILLNGCWASSTGTASISAIGFRFTAADGVILNSCRAINNGGHGVLVNSTALNIEIYGGLYTGNSQQSSGVANGITIAASAQKVNIVGAKCGVVAGAANQQAYGINIGASTDNISVLDCDVVGNLSAGIIDGCTTVGHRVMNNRGYNPTVTTVTQPSVPATTVAQNNTTGQDCTVYINGGTLTDIKVGGVSLGLPAATTNIGIAVPAGSSISMTYSVAPTWKWAGI